MINFDYITKENRKEHNQKIPDHPYRILIIEASRSGKKCIIQLNKSRNRY